MFYDRVGLIDCRRIGALGRFGIIDADDLAANPFVEGNVHGFVHVSAPEDETPAVQFE